MLLLALRKNCVLWKMNVYITQLSIITTKYFSKSVYKEKSLFWFMASRVSGFPGWMLLFFKSVDSKHHGGGAWRSKAAHFMKARDPRECLTPISHPRSSQQLTSFHQGPAPEVSTSLESSDLLHIACGLYGTQPPAKPQLPSEGKGSWAITGRCNVLSLENFLLC